MGDNPPLASPTRTARDRARGRNNCLRRATLLQASLTLFALVLPALSLAQTPRSTVSAVGVIDFRSRPTFQAGDFVRYHVVGTNSKGFQEDYYLTLVIVGDDDFWGDRCFWVETWTDPAKPSQESPSTATAALLSYSIFGDSLAIPRMQSYTRKIIFETDESGRPVTRVVKRTEGRARARVSSVPGATVVTDTVGVDSVLTPMGATSVQRVEIKTGTGMEASGGDSTVYTELRETRTRLVDFKVPITHIARETIDRTVKKLTWMVGRSKESAAERVEEKALTNWRLVEYGRNMQPRLVPIAVTPGGAPAYRPSRPAKSATPRRTNG